MAKILIIEGDTALLEFLSIFLKRNDFQIRAVSLKNEIEFAVEDFKPDIILLDVLLGGYDGRQICREIKATNKLVSVILLSTNPKLLEHYDECDADDAIEKPFDNENILKTIRRLLNKTSTITY
ncbi:MAG TPA: response regulator [Ferruginibacter sp.]|nr:response regulator [Ferruginibacter sp.]